MLPPKPRQAKGPSVPDKPPKVTEEHVYVHLVDLPLIVATLTQIGRGIMSALDDFNQAIQDFSAEVATDLSALNTALTAELTRVADALAAMPSTQALMDATTAVNAAKDKVSAGIQAVIDTLNSELPAPPIEP